MKIRPGLGRSGTGNDMKSNIKFNLVMITAIISILIFSGFMCEIPREECRESTKKYADVMCYSLLFDFNCRQKRIDRGEDPALCDSGMDQSIIMCLRAIDSQKECDDDIAIPLPAT